jgi:3-oxoadipate enol-lactonase
MWDGFDLPGALRHELRGYGRTPLPPGGSFSHTDDLEQALGGEPAALVGASFGGLVCLELAARRPQLVSELVLLDAPLPDHDWSAELEEYEREEDELFEQGEHRAIARLNARFWLAPGNLDAIGERVVEMYEQALGLQAESEAEAELPERVDPGAVKARTLVVVGELDKPDFHAIAERLASEIANARHVVVEGAGHLPALERPAETARLVREFLGS